MNLYLIKLKCFIVVFNYLIKDLLRLAWRGEDGYATPIERGPGRINGAVESLKTYFNKDVEFNLEDF